VILFNKIIRTDLILLAGIVALVLVKPGALRDVLTGFTAAVFVLSVAFHLQQYKLYRKFY